MKKILILEDNKLVQEYLSKIIEELETKTEVYLFDNAKDAYYCAMEKTIDLFVVDVILEPNRPGDSSGLNYIENIRQINHYMFTPVIVVTSLEDNKLYTYQELHCFGFLEKPFDEARLRSLVQKALNYPGTGRKQKSLYFRIDGIIYAVERESIVYTESIRHILHIYQKGNNVLQVPYRAIKTLLEELDSSDFIQCSRNTVVNKSFIQYVDMPNGVIQLKDGMGRLSIGPLYKNKLREML